MTERFHLRPYRAEDEDAAIALWQRTWQQAYPTIDFAARVNWWRERWRSELVPKAAVIVAEQDGALLGFVTMLFLWTESAGYWAVGLGYSFIGAGVGFLWFNAPPAQIFMGDTGSLALGGMLGAIAVAVKHEIVLAVIGGLFVLEAVSVIVQVVSFKLTGKRVFRMAPIHHHFEQLGWTEPQIVIRFWIISVMLALAGLSTLKLR